MDAPLEAIVRGRMRGCRLVSEGGASSVRCVATLAAGTAASLRNSDVADMSG